VLDEALCTDGPVIVEAQVDPSEHPFPPKATVVELRKLGETLMKGTPNRKQMALTIASDKVRGMVWAVGRSR
jgi:pyruvate dehydrogenase (quinone)